MKILLVIDEAIWAHNVIRRKRLSFKNAVPFSDLRIAGAAERWRVRLPDPIVGDSGVLHHPAVGAEENRHSIHAPARNREPNPAAASREFLKKSPIPHEYNELSPGDFLGPQHDRPGPASGSEVVMGKPGMALEPFDLHPDLKSEGVELLERVGKEVAIWNSPAAHLPAVIHEGIDVDGHPVAQGRS